MRILTERDYSIEVDENRHTIVGLTDSERKEIGVLARWRNDSKKESYLEYKRLDSSDRWRENRFGVAGEFAFAKLIGLPMNKAILPGGDGGVDFPTRIGPVGVKTAVLPKYLFLKHVDGCPCGQLADQEANISGRLATSDFLVLATTPADHSAILFLGWESTETLLKQPKRIFDYRLKYDNHYKKQESLRPMNELLLALRG